LLKCHVLLAKIPLLLLDFPDLILFASLLAKSAGFLAYFTWTARRFQSVWSAWRFFSLPWANNKTHLHPSHQSL
jgi:hypothetical protein